MRRGGRRKDEKTGPRHWHQHQHQRRQQTTYDEGDDDDELHAHAYEPLLIGVGGVLGACERDVAGIREVGGAYLASASLHGPPAPSSSLLPILAISPCSVVPFMHRSSPSCSSFHQNPIDSA